MRVPVTNCFQYGSGMITALLHFRRKLANEVPIKGCAVVPREEISGESGVQILCG
jgi:hypothetical protein